jgi:hypothetical protein
MILKRTGSMLAKKQHGGQFDYSNTAIVIMLTVKEVFQGGARSCK